MIIQPLSSGSKGNSVWIESGSTRLLVEAGLRGPELLERIKLAGMEPPRDLAPDITAELKAAIGNAFVSGFRLVMWICVGLAVTSALIALTTIRGHRVRMPKPR